MVSHFAFNERPPAVDGYWLLMFYRTLVGVDVLTKVLLDGDDEFRNCVPAYGHRDVQLYVSTVTGANLTPRVFVDAAGVDEPLVRSYVAALSGL